MVYGIIICCVEKYEYLRTGDFEHVYLQIQRSVIKNYISGFQKYRLF